MEDPESEIVTLSWCIGSEPGSCDQIQNTPVDVTFTKMSAFLDQPATNGNKFHVTVTAVNSAGLSATMISDGVTVDYTSPVAGMVVAGQNNHTDYINNDDTIYVHWSGFKDTVSGIRSYAFALCEKKNASRCPLEFTNIDLQTNVTLSGLLNFWLSSRLTILLRIVFRKQEMPGREKNEHKSQTNERLFLFFKVMQLDYLFENSFYLILSSVTRPDLTSYLFKNF